MRNPRHTRVYLDAAGTMAVNELIFTARLLSGSVRDIRDAYIGGVPYVLFEKGDALTAGDVRHLSRLSFAYALFELHGKTGQANVNRNGNNAGNAIYECDTNTVEYITPIPKNHGYFIDEDISSILKYSGKTNELFTRLMLNLALAHMQPAQPIRVFDPMAGKGTTLYEALIHGLDAYGVEIDPKPAYEAFVYIKKHFELARYKHHSHTEKTGGIDAVGKKFAAVRYQVEMSRSKDEQKSGQARKFEMIAGDTRHASAFYKKDFFHAIVADLPYGVQHSAKKKPQGGGFTRNALELLREAMPGWVKLLKPGGVIALAWNLFLINRDEMVKLFAQHGLAVQEELDFSHRLDQATHRDLIIGIKKA